MDFCAHAGPTRAARLGPGFFVIDCLSLVGPDEDEVWLCPLKALSLPAPDSPTPLPCVVASFQPVNQLSSWRVGPALQCCSARLEAHHHRIAALTIVLILHLTSPPSPHLSSRRRCHPSAHARPAETLNIEHRRLNIEHRTSNIEYRSHRRTNTD